MRSSTRSFAQEEEKQQFVQFMAAFARVNRVGMNSSICTQRHAGLVPHRNSVPTTIPERFSLAGLTSRGLMITSFIPDALRFLQKETKRFASSSSSSSPLSMSKSRCNNLLLLCPFLFFLCAIRTGGQQQPIQVPSS